MAAPETETFKHHYDTLKRIAEQMRTQQEPDIDQLIPQVDSALASYKVCKDRLDTVKKLLDERFGSEEGAAGS
jgi:exodeoxyribonuclease VII small subunit